MTKLEFESLSDHELVPRIEMAFIRGTHAVPGATRVRMSAHTYARLHGLGMVMADSTRTQTQWAAMDRLLILGHCQSQKIEVKSNIEPGVLEFE